MEISRENASINILNNLQTLEKYTSADIGEQCELDEIYNILKETTEWTYESIASEEIEIALQILDLLEFLDNKLNFEEKFKDYLLIYVIYNNIAACYQIMWDISKATHY